MDQTPTRERLPGTQCASERQPADEAFGLCREQAACPAQTRCARTVRLVAELHTWVDDRPRGWAGAGTFFGGSASPVPRRLTRIIHEPQARWRPVLVELGRTGRQRVPADVRGVFGKMATTCLSASPCNFTREVDESSGFTPEMQVPALGATDAGGADAMPVRGTRTRASGVESRTAAEWIRTARAMTTAEAVRPRACRRRGDD